MMFEQRSAERYESFDNKMDYVLDPFSEDPVFEAELVNYSETGLCILSSHLLSVGQEITIKDLLAFPLRTAVVTWSEKYDDQELFKIGLRFS